MRSYIWSESFSTFILFSASSEVSGGYAQARMRIRCSHLLQNLEHIFVSNINKHLACFRSRRSCETHFVQFVHDIISNLDGVINRGHKQTDLIIMDFAKAFDKVPHRRLLHNLNYYGIRG